MKYILISILGIILGFYLNSFLTKQQFQEEDRKIEIETVIEHSTDTVFIPMPIGGSETPLQSKIDSSEYKVFTYEEKSDSAQYSLSLYQKEPPLWYILNYQQKKKIELIEKNGDILPTDNNTSVTIIPKKYKLKEHIKFQPQIGLGYGIINKKFDCYVGIGITYKF